MKQAKNSPKGIDGIKKSCCIKDEIKSDFPPREILNGNRTVEFPERSAFDVLRNGRKLENLVGSDAGKRQSNFLRHANDNAISYFTRQPTRYDWKRIFRSRFNSNLISYITADSSSQYDAIRAYLKELDIIEKVWIGLSKPQEKPNFLWTDFHPLSGEGHWQESLPTGDSQSLCAVMDPGTDFLWRTLPCGGPEVAAFICEMPIPSWALGPKGCLLTELPSLTVLYIPEQSALELTSDCGLDGTKRIACKGNADREEMLRQLTCVIPNEDVDEDKSTKTSTSDYFESSTWDEGKTTKGWTSNTINADDGPSTRHRRETEDTLSPVSTKSSFKQEESPADLSWRDTHQEKGVLTTQHAPALDEHVTPTPATNFELIQTTTITENLFTVAEKKTKEPATEKPESTTVSHKIMEEPLKNSTDEKATEGTSTTAVQEGNVEDYPSAINQGQLFSIIENGTMFDIIELNETDQDALALKHAATTTEPTTEKSTRILTTDSPPAKKAYTKKPVEPLKKDAQTKKDLLPKRATSTRPPTVDEIEENLTKEFEMMPNIKDTSVKLNRTFRKELPAMHDEHTSLESGGQYGVPRIINFTVTNAIDTDEGFQQDQPQAVGNVSSNAETKEDVTPSVVKKSEPKEEESHIKKPEVTEVVKTPIDPRLYVLNHHPNALANNLSESVAPIEKSKIAKEDFLPKSLLGDKPAPSAPATTVIYEGNSDHPFPSDEPKKANRHRTLHTTKGRKFYPYFFSRMLG